ncbi:MAG: esterase [Candidatus Electrothrix sp. GM3_4]|nr:esterase [Candidatus Electrothrix sp. GM3_4]
MNPFKTKNLFVLLCLLPLITACASNDPLFNPTGRAAYVPDESVPFTEYVRESHENIEQVLNEVRPDNGDRKYLGGYTNAQAAAMRSPFQVPENENERCSDISNGAGKGFLLIHGLIDSPYLLSNIQDSLIRQYPCALIRAVLLSGDGTVVGDSLDMNHKDWKRIVDYGVQGFQDDDGIKDLYIVGFSTGTSLAIDFMKEHPSTDATARADKIKGLVLLSPSVKAKSHFAFLSSFLNLFRDWLSRSKEEDAVRYESFSYKAGAEFYTLTRGMVDPKYALKVPVVMVASADDTTVDAEAARRFFCFSDEVVRGGALIWYQSINPDVNARIAQTSDLQCNNIIEVSLDDIKKEFKTVNISHLAVPMSPDDSHYGLHGKYRHCGKYASSPTDFAACQDDGENNLFGENNVEGLPADLKPQYKTLRRGTFNPFYEQMESMIFCFIDDACSTDTLLKIK